MKHYAFEQGTDLWLQCRSGKITASRCKDARDRLKNGNPSGKMTAYAAQVAVERIAKSPIDQGFENWQMREGHVQEPLARIAYETKTGNLVQEVGALATDDDRFLYSPDGLVSDDGLIEIKSLFSAERICNIVGGGDISDFVDQCNFGLWLTGRKWVDLVIWAPALANIGLDMTIIRIDRDEDAIDAMENELVQFAAMVAEIEDRLRAKAAALAQAATPDDPLPVTTAPDPAPYVLTPQDTGATMRLGQICERLGFTLTADFVASLGFHPVATDKAAKLYQESDFPKICTALVRHVQAVARGVEA